MATPSDSRAILIVGGGTAGITVAARSRRSGATDITVPDPEVTHYYQPLWTLVGGGQADIRSTGRPESSVIPRGVNWIREAATGFHPAERAKERRDRWLLKRYGLPVRYWHAMCSTELPDPCPRWAPPPSRDRQSHPVQKGHP